MVNKIKQRWKYLLSFYLLGYIISLFVTGIPNFYYIIPIKLSALIFSVFAGNAIYHSSKKMPIYYAPFKGMKYCLVIIVLVLLFNLLKIALIQFNIDITPFIGVSNN